LKLVHGGPNPWPRARFEEDAQFHAGLAAVSIPLRSVKLKQTNRALMAGSDPLRKLEFAPVVRRHRDPAAVDERMAVIARVAGQTEIPLNCIAHAGGFGKA